MKKILFLAVIAAAAFSCKKSPYNQQTEEGFEISIATNTATKAQHVVDYEKNSRNDFFTGDKIGIFLANQTAAIVKPFAFDETADPGKSHRFNVGYDYALPFWKIIPTTPTATDRLKFPVVADKVAKLYAYFPYAPTTVSPNADGKTLAIDTVNTATLNCIEVSNATNKAVLKYALPQYQLSKELLRVMDIMYAKSEGDGAATTGWALTSKGIKLEFNHLMSKVSFKVAISNSATTDGTTVDSRYIRAIELNGKNILVGTSTLDIEDGTFTAPSTTGAVMFRAIAANSGVELTTLAGGGLNPADFSNYDADKRVDMLIYPFSAAQLADQNEIVIYLSKTNTAIANLGTAVEDGTVDRYIKAIPTPGTDGTDSWKFNANSANVMNVTIDVATKAINISSTIKPWGAEVVHNFPAE